MTTFTFRISKNYADHMTSAQMRSWVAEFLQNPRTLPRDPGSGDHRISLTLPAEQIRELSGIVGCRPSSALRRLATERLGFISKSGLAAIPKPGVPHSTSAPKTTPAQPSVTGSTSLKEVVERRRRLAALRNKTGSPISEKNAEAGQGWFLVAGAVAFLAFLFFGFGNGNALE